MITAPEKTEQEKMHSKPYRFIWFARTSWGFMQGQRIKMIFGFPKAWRFFNQKLEDDIKLEAKQ